VAVEPVLAWFPLGYFFLFVSIFLFLPSIPFILFFSLAA
jgi:hypothetical protein